MKYKMKLVNIFNILFNIGRIYKKFDKIFLIFHLTNKHVYLYCIR